MAEFFTDTPERILSDDGGHAYRNYLDWTLGTGFALAILEITEPRHRNELLAWTVNQVPETRVVEMDRASGKPLRPLLDAAVAPPGKPGILVMMRLEEAADRHVIFARLNIQRDELARDYALPWVIMIHPAAALEMTMRAPDLVHFAGMWWREERKAASVRPGTLDMRGQTSSAQLSSKLELTEGSEILIEAQHALELGQLDEAADLLAQIDMRDPNGRDTDGTRLALRGRLAWQRGEPEQALAQFGAARRAFGQVGDERARAITMGDVANILYSRGELDEALRIYREEKLPVFERLGDEYNKAITMGKVADILEARGELDEALRIYREEVVPIFERLGDKRAKAATMSQIADILQARGELDEALRIRREEELPVFERLGDARNKAITMGKVADILHTRGELDEALRIRREEELPIYERLGDVHAKAVSMGNIADILTIRGKLDEALRIRREEELPVYEKVGDVRSKAITMGSIANIFQVRGQIDEALRIRREEVLPVLERLGDVRSLLVGRTNLALSLASRGRAEDKPEIVQLLAQALADARRLRLPEAQQIETIVRAQGENPDAPPFTPA